MATARLPGTNIQGPNVSVRGDVPIRFLQHIHIKYSVFLHDHRVI